MFSTSIGTSSGEPASPLGEGRTWATSGATSLIETGTRGGATGGSAMLAARTEGVADGVILWDPFSLKYPLECFIFLRSHLVSDKLEKYHGRLDCEKFVRIPEVERI